MGVLKITAQNLDFVFVSLQDLMNKSLPDSDFVGGSETTIADASDAAASGLRHEGFEADDFVLEPFGFLRGMAVVVPVSRLREFAEVMRMMRCAHPMQNALDD